jgi:MFS family permease
MTETTMPPPRPDSVGAKALLRLLRSNGDFRRLFGALVVSLTGDWFAIVAVSAQVIEGTGRDGLAAVVFAASVLPVFLMAPIAGVVADRIDRRTVMIAADLARIVPALGLIVAGALDSAWLSIGCIATIAALSAFFEPIASASLPRLVDREDLSLAQSALGAVWGSMLFVGAAVGGVVAATVGRDASFVVNGATFALSAFLVWRIRRPLKAEAPVPAQSLFADLRDVGGFVLPRPVTRSLMTSKSGVGVANGLVGLLPAIAVGTYGATEAGIGVLIAGRGLGALVGPFIGRRIAGRDGRRLLAVCGVSMLTYGATYAFLPVAGSLTVAAVLVTAAHVGGGAQWMLSTYGLQVTTPDAIRARVMSLDYGLATMAAGVSALAAGAVTDLIGLRVTTTALSALAMVYGICWLWATRGLWRRSDDPIAAETVPS